MMRAGHRLGLALSGGGFRATLFHLGVIRYLRDAGLLEQIGTICSVSGGSILAAHLALHWREYLSGDFDRAAEPILRFVQLGIRNRISRRYPLFFLGHLAKGMLPLPTAVFSATEALHSLYARWLFDDASLGALRPGDEARPTLYILATNLSTGRLSAFTHEGYFDGMQLHATEVPDVALAVAASSAFTGFFPPISVTPAVLGLGAGDELQPSTHFLTDGGVYDNLGVRAFSSIVPPGSLDNVLISNASLKFAETVSQRFQGPLRTALRSADILTRRIALLEQEHANTLAHTDATGHFAFIQLEEVIQEAPSGVAGTKSDTTGVLPLNVQLQLPYVRTDLDSFSDLEINCLAVHGYCVARQTAAHLSSGSDVASLRPWVPKPHVPSDTLSVATKTNLLRAGAIRRVRPFSWGDPVSFAYAVLLALVLVGVLIGPSLLRETSAKAAYPNLKSEAAKLLEDQRRALSTNLKLRIHDHGIMTSPPNQGWLDTWSTSQAAYALLRQLDAVPASRPLRSQIYQAMRARLRPAIEYVPPRGLAISAPKEPWDFIGNGRGWYARPGELDERADPCLWMLAAVAVGLRLENASLSDPSDLTKLQHLLSQTEPLLARYWDGGTGAWSTFADQPKEIRGQAYSSTLAILALVEVRRSRLLLTVAGMPVDDAILKTARWLVEDFVSEETPGWRAMGKSSENEVTEAFTLQAYAVLLQVEADFPERFHLEGRLLEHLRNLMSRADHPGDDSIERLWVVVAPDKKEEKSTLLLWKPWAVATLVGWMRRLDRMDAPWTERATALRNVKRIVERQGRYVDRLATDLTFRSSELLYGLTLLEEYVVHAQRTAP